MIKNSFYLYFLVIGSQSQTLGVCEWRGIVSQCNGIYQYLVSFTCFTDNSNMRKFMAEGRHIDWRKIGFYIALNYFDVLVELHCNWICMQLINVEDFIERNLLSFCWKKKDFLTKAVEVDTKACFCLILGFEPVNFSLFQFFDFLCLYKLTTIYSSEYCRILQSHHHHYTVTYTLEIKKAHWVKK